MAPSPERRRWLAVVLLLCSGFVFGSRSALAERPLRSSLVQAASGGSFRERDVEDDTLPLRNLARSLFGNGSRAHNWPDLELGWRVVLGSAIAFVGSALGSIGGVGGGGIFVPMLVLIIGFDLKTSAAISKCMIMGAAGSAVYYNLRFRHPTLDLPIMDYDLALLFQPMLMLGISIGVAFNVIFAEWMITAILVILFLGTSTKAFLKGLETWKKETVLLKDAARHLDSSTNLNDGPELEYAPLPEGPLANEQPKSSASGAVLTIVPIKENIYVKELMLLLIVWVGFLVIQIIKTHAVICSPEYWIFNFMQVPIAAALTLYEAICLYRGKRTIASTGKQEMNWRPHQLVFYCCCGVIAGVVGGLLGLGGGFILGPLFIELGVPPQVASATSNFVMAFSSSISVVQYYLLDRFPVPYSAYLLCVATLAAVAGQHMVRKMIILIGRASLIIFILALTILVSAIGIGGLGMEDVVGKLARKEHMGFENLCLQSS
ncbi:sulfite exporter TauE/SafE family protein 3 [Musa acuminata AAA Group]|uniref:sulfite exporter TauE/SafE family protein 3 n=1 Tax=Musa acuminata AAA Group TaxID=214697 RepID=UPI0031D409E5